MKPPYRLVPDTLSADTVECLRQLLEDAEAGKIQGLVFGAMYRGRTVIVNSAGECRRNRIFARGIVAELNDELSSNAYPL